MPATARQIAAASTLACLAAGCAEPPAPQTSRGDRVVEVIVEPLQFELTRTRLEAVGTSRALRSIELYPAASGEVVAVNFAPGQPVERGDVLVSLDSRDEELAVALAEVRLADARRLYERYVRSGESGAVLPTDVDTARTAVEAARIELERARVALDDRTVEAPFAGYADLTEVEAGDRIGPDTLITTLDDRSELLVTFEVPELLIADLVVGGEVSLATWSDRAGRLSGRVVEIGSRIDPLTRTFEVRAAVANGEDRLRPGMSFRVTVDLEGTAHPVVHETALQWGADGAYVWSVVDDRAKRIPVTIAQRQQGRVLIDGELGETELIVVEGVQRMREGLAVSYQRPAISDRAPGAARGAAPGGAN